MYHVLLYMRIMLNLNLHVVYSPNCEIM